MDGFSLNSDFSQQSDFSENEDLSQVIQINEALEEWASQEKKQEKPKSISGQQIRDSKIAKSIETDVNGKKQSNDFENQAYNTEVQQPELYLCENSEKREEDLESLQKSGDTIKSQESGEVELYKSP